MATERLISDFLNDFCVPGCPELGKGPVSKTGAARRTGSNPVPGVQMLAQYLQYRGLTATTSEELSQKSFDSLNKFNSILLQCFKNRFLNACFDAVLKFFPQVFSIHALRLVC